jgi:predicted RNA-binding Zn-ribbon protein involved in translation (DUF1610 family)
MTNDSDRSHRELAHYHACIHCGSRFRKEDFDGRTIATGIYPCSKCGLEGPLNIVIQPSDNSTGDVGQSANDRSAT